LYLTVHRLQLKGHTLNTFKADVGAARTQTHSHTVRAHTLYMHRLILADWGLLRGEMRNSIKNRTLHRSFNRQWHSNEGSGWRFCVRRYHFPSREKKKERRRKKKERRRKT